MNKASIHNEWHRRRLACDAIAHPVERRVPARACSAVLHRSRWRHGIHSELARENGSAIRNVSSRARTSLISRQVTAILL
jgi:hypothetical protein